MFLSAALKQEELNKIYQPAKTLLCKERQVFFMKTVWYEKYRGLIVLFIVSLSFILCGIAEGFMTADNVRNDCLRLHIPANSDSSEDQSVKLKVRDEILKTAEALFNNCGSAEEARKIILDNKALLEETADKILKENGFDYSSSLSVEKEFFETRSYDNVTLPAGEYTACKITLGEGKGQNWWCVMFPGICLPAASGDSSDEVYAVFGTRGGDFVTGKSGYKIKFRIVEIVEELLQSSNKQ